uniref:Pentacotripeptide-repeat region of PRORP domain-containing protein n=1 Tax=Skeletonema marinoi TaxID=267567 RepID=A0A7S1CV07_9STRA|mmetsp:Transcript_2141/g.3096  ORF Transcript_2141/g.3096 Transcript_2141/m.3096 type:complete len:822 (+) Transcript_2141:197-2662(+)
MLAVLSILAWVQLVATTDAFSPVSSQSRSLLTQYEHTLDRRNRIQVGPVFATKGGGGSVTANKGKNISASLKSSGNKSTAKRHNNNRSKRRSNTKKSSRRRYKRTSRPYANYNTEELKQLTEYHLSKSIPSEKANDNQETTLIGDMSAEQMQEFAKLISSWSKLSTNNRGERTLAAEMSEQCLRELIEEKLAGNKRIVQFMNADMYHSVIRAWLKTNSHVDLLHATSLLDLMERTHKGEDKISSNSIRCYATVLDGWCKSRYSGAEVKAEELLHRMSQRCAGEIDVRYYNNVMNRIAVSGKKDAGKQAERLLNVLIESYKKGKGNFVPDRSSFNTVIKAYARTPANTKNGKHAAKDARRILSMMEDAASSGLGGIARDIEPDKVSCTSILTAWANSGERDAGERAEQLLQRMEDMYSRGNLGIKPDTVTYNAVIKVWGRCGSRQAGERSEALLRKMFKLYEEGNADVRPDDVTFNSVIHNIANSNEPDSPKRANRLLEQMEQSYEAGIIAAKPDIISYNSVLDAFAKSHRPGAAADAEEMLDNLENSYDSGVWNIEPDVYSYNIVISAWGKRGEAHKAVALLDRMTSGPLKGKTAIKPDTTTYNSVLNAWSQSSDRNAPVKALGLLEIMFRLYEGGDKTAQPDVLSISTVINAFSKSKFPGKSREARNLLRRMKKLYEQGEKKMQPNVYVYAAVLNTCAYAFGRNEEKEEALKVGIETYEELQSSNIEANHVVYGSFIRLCRKLMPMDDARRNHFITRAFRQCCSDGMVGEYVLKQLRAVPDVYTSMLQSYIVDVNVPIEDLSLPKKWSRNVRDRRQNRFR